MVSNTSNSKVWMRGLKKFSNMDRYQFLKKFGYGYTFSLLQPG